MGPRILHHLSGFYPIFFACFNFKDLGWNAKMDITSHARQSSKLSVSKVCFDVTSCVASLFSTEDSPNSWILYAAAGVHRHDWGCWNGVVSSHLACFLDHCRCNIEEGSRNLRSRSLRLRIIYGESFANSFWICCLLRTDVCVSNLKWIYIQTDFQSLKDWLRIENYWPGP